MQTTVQIIDSHAPQTILGQQRARFPVGGKIRAGIKVPTANAAKIPELVAMYEQEVAAGHDFKHVERVLGRHFPEHAKLRPCNVEWFTARPADFANPDLAVRLLDLYGETREDGVRRLYRFPVIFPSDNWQDVMPHEMACWSKSERKFWSEYSSDGTARFCMQHAPVPKAGNTNRVVRLFGGRKRIQRAVNDGACVPEVCAEYQARLCNLTGRFVFFVPGLPTLDAIELATNSYYAMSRAIDKFRAVSAVRNGRLSGFLDATGATFFITKQWREVSRIDDNGIATRSGQWLIELDTNVDVATLLLERSEPVLLASAATAAMVLQGSAESLAVPTVTVEPASDHRAGATAHHDDGDTGDASLARNRRRSSQPPSGFQRADAACDDEPALAPLSSALRTRGATLEQFDVYATQRWGSGWKRNAGGRGRALAIVTACRDQAALAAVLNSQEHQP